MNTRLKCLWQYLIERAPSNVENGNIQVPFSHETRDLVLEKLSDMNFVQEICDDLHTLFEVKQSLGHGATFCLFQFQVKSFRPTKASTG